MSLLSPSFNTGAYTVTRSSGHGTTVDGHYTPPATTTIPSVFASVQPVSGRALKDLREGVSADDVRMVFTDTPLFTVDQNHDFQDFIDIPDDSGRLERYRVTNVKHFTVLSGHYLAIVERTEVP
jgi:hypothetical protein